jgi:GNAT superfamily N-acetyltransferase
MTGDDLPLAHGLSRTVQWPHRIEEWQFNFRLGHGLVAEQGDDMVGTLMWWPHGDAVATLGMVIVSPDRQKAGIGRMLMTSALERSGDRTILLNATEAGLPLYRSLGFRPVGEIRQHQGAAFSVPLAPLGSGERIRPIGRGDTAALAVLDSKATGLSRAALVTALLDEAEGVILDRDGETVGFALFRRFGRGYAIGPVIAPTIEGAKALISHWVASNAGMFIRVDIPSDGGLSEWLEDLGLVGVGSVVTMARGALPDRDGAYPCWAIVSQALG